MESWKYGDPQQIGDALLARTARLDKAEARKLKAKASARAKKDGFYRQSKSIHFKELVKVAKRGGHRA
jgi:hypothetical protein